MMRKLIPFTSLLITLLVTACSTAVPSPSAPPAALPGQSAADAQATLNAWQLQQQATAEANRQATAVAQSATRVAIQSTEQAQSIATGTAQAELSARMATSDALAFQATSQAISFDATRQSFAIVATVTAEAQQAAVVEALRADEAARLAQQREDERIRQERQRLVNAWLPVVMIALILVIVGGTAALIYIQLTKNRPVTIHHDNRQITILPNGKGGFQMLPIREQRPLLPAPQEGEIIENGEYEPVLEAIADEQAILVHGAKGTGKTTLLLWLMAQRQNALIVDPHGAPGKWPNCYTVGNGRDFEAINTTLHQIEALMTARYGEIGRGDVVEGNHEKLTLFIDEYRAIVGQVPDARKIIATLLTEARKANIDIVLVSHSRNVKALGLDGEGDLREGFAFVHLNMVRGQRQAQVVYGMDDDTAVPVSLPGAFNTAVQPRYAVNRADQIIGRILYMAPELQAPDGLHTDWGFLPRPDIERILLTAARNKAQFGRELRRSICNELYGYEGGDSYRQIKYVLDIMTDVSYNTADVGNLTQWLIDTAENVTATA